MAKKALKSAKIQQKTLSTLSDLPPTPPSLIHILEINNIHNKEFFYPHAMILYFENLGGGDFNETPCIFPAQFSLYLLTVKIAFRYI